MWDLRHKILSQQQRWLITQRDCATLSQHHSLSKQLYWTKTRKVKVNNRSKRKEGERSHNWQKGVLTWRTMGFPKRNISTIYQLQCSNKFPLICLSKVQRKNSCKNRLYKIQNQKDITKVLLKVSFNKAKTTTFQILCVKWEISEEKRIFV
jgi:hypothetical protein